MPSTSSYPFLFGWMHFRKDSARTEEPHMCLLPAAGMGATQNRSRPSVSCPFFFYAFFHYQCLFPQPVNLEACRNLTTWRLTSVFWRVFTENWGVGRAGGAGKPNHLVKRMFLNFVLSWFYCTQFLKKKINLTLELLIQVNMYFIGEHLVCSWCKLISDSEGN